MSKPGQQREKSRKIQIYTVSVIFISLLISITLKFTRTLESFELAAFNILYSIKGNIEATHEVVLVDIDDTSIEALGHFPLRRDLYARALETLQLFSAGQVVLDIEFPDASPLFLKTSQASKVKTTSDLKRLLVMADSEFSQALENYQETYLATAFYTQADDRATTEAYQRAIARLAEQSKEFGQLSSSGRVEKFSLKKSFLPALPSLFHRQAAVGFSTIDFDTDGQVRRVPLFVSFSPATGQKLIVPQLSFNALLDRLGADRSRIRVDDGHVQVPLAEKTIRIPIDRAGRVLINWAGNYNDKGAFLHIPLHLLVNLEQVIRFQREDVSLLNDTFEINDQARRFSLQNQSEFFALNKTLHETVTENKKQWFKELDELKEYLRVAPANEKAELKKNIQDLTYLVETVLNRDNAISSLDRLKGAMVLIGHTATGTTDIAATPVNRQGNYPLVGVHANLLNTILSGQFLQRADNLINIGLIIMGVIFVWYWFSAKTAVRSVLYTTILMLFGLVAAIVAFASFNYWLDIIAIELAIIVPASILGSYHFISQERQRRFIKHAFGMYLSPTVIDQIIDQNKEISLGGEEKVLTAFFSDIKGFTSISERLSPQATVLLINSYLTEMCDVITRYQGTVDKFEGDGIMAFYGAPLEDEKHAYHCCAAALEMQERLAYLRKEVWQPKDEPLLFVRIGINTGPMIIGNMGSQTRVDYTIIGDAVNLSARLEGVNKVYGTSIMLSEFTYEHVKDDFEFRELDLITVVGKDKPVKIYELLSKKGNLTSKQKQLLALYRQGRDLMSQNKFKQAIDCFKRALEIDANDGPSKVFLERCTYFTDHPGEYSAVHHLTKK